MDFTDGIEALDLEHEKDFDSELVVGGELTVMDEISEDKKGSILISNGAHFYGCLADSLNNVAVENDQIEDFPLHKIFYNLILRDMKASLYLAMSGWTRQATLLLRPTIENIAAGVVLKSEEYPAEKMKAFWNGELEGKPNVGDFKRVIEDELVTDIEEFDLPEPDDIGQLYGFLSGRIHGSIGGEYERYEVEEREAPIPPWSSAYHEGKLEDWYIYYTEICWIVLWIIPSFWGAEVLQEGVNYLADCYEELQEGKASDFDFENEVELDVKIETGDE